MIDKDKRELGGWWIWILILLAISSIVLATLGYFGKFTSTVVERKVFEQSYQKQAGDSKRVRTWKAQLAAINSILATEEDPNIRRDLAAQKAMLLIQLQGN